MPNNWSSNDLESHYFGEERKQGKKDRKLLKKQDRSRYKKTDLSKWERTKKETLEKASSKEGLLRGRVLSIGSEQVIVDFDGASVVCHLRGLLKKEKSQVKNLIAVGDFVLFERLHGEEGTISVVEERKSILSRQDNLSRKKQQVIAANIDLVLITLSVVLPPLKTSLADRYIIAAEKGGMQPVVIVNKIDLLEGEQNEEIEIEKVLYDAFSEGYIRANVPFIGVSAKTGEGVEQLKAIMKDKASVFSGQSGVGKSSLINLMTGLDLKVSNPVDRTKKGAHTTTAPKLIPLPFGGFCIDTPGIKSFGVWDLTKEEVEAYFDEIHSLGSLCQFPDCRHLHEENCKVKEAVMKGELSPLRYASYLNLLETLGQAHLRR